MARDAAPFNPGGMSSTGRPRSSALPVLLLATMVIRSTRRDRPVVSDDADPRDEVHQIRVNTLFPGRTETLCVTELAADPQDAAAPRYEKRA
jgi:hypothetical protein